MPKAGGAIWAVAWFVPKTAAHVHLANQFINRALQSRIQALTSETAVCSPVSSRAPAPMNEVMRGLFHHDNLDTAFAANKIFGLAPRSRTRRKDPG